MKENEQLMTCKNMTAVTIATILCILSGSTALAQHHGGGFGGGGGFGRSGFHDGGSRGASNGHGFGGRGFRGDRFRHHRFGDRFVFFGDFGDPFLYDSFYGYYPYGGYPYGYGYNSYNPEIYPGAGYTESLTEQLQVHLALAGFYHGTIDGVNGVATRRAIREYERVHGLPANGQITGRLLTAMGLG